VEHTFEGEPTGGVSVARKAATRGFEFIMGMKRAFLQLIALLLGAISLVNCSGSPSCVLISTAATPVQALSRKPAAAAAGCPVNSGGGGGGNGACSNTLTPNEVLLSINGTPAIQTLAISTGATPLALMCTTAAAPGVEIAVSQNRFAYVLDGTTKKISGYVIGHVQPVTLTPILGQPFSISAVFSTFFEMRTDPLGRFLFVTDSGVGRVHVFLIDANTGALTEAQNSPFSVPNALFTAVTPSGTFVYITDPTDGEIFILKIDAGGQLTATQNSPFVVPSHLTADAPIDIAMHSSGKFLFTSNFLSVASYVIDPITGDLVDAPGSPNSTTGTLPTAVQPQFLGVDGTGVFLYVTGRSGQGVIGYTVDPTSGTLAIISNNSFALTTNADAITADPVGGQVFLEILGAINAFPIDPVSGSLLTPTGASQFSTLSNMVVANVQ
jgi:6-phosphogluconolactonase (cycloisomerase 2 family)